MAEPIFNYNIHKSVLQEPNTRIGPVNNVVPAPFNLKAPDKTEKSEKAKRDKDKEKEKKERPFQ